MNNKLPFTLVFVLLLSLLPLMSVTAQDPPFTQAPSLDELVETGELPPLEDRIPVMPQVTTPLVEVGQYGGELRFGFVGADAFWGGLWYQNGWEMIAAWEPDFSGVEPNIVSGWEISDDVREYTFFLREGMRWSDGQPFTADDWMFYIEDVLFNEEIFPTGPVADWLPSEGADQFVLEKIDDYTVKFRFANPYGVFLINLVQWPGRDFMAYPAHFLKQFHADYNPDVDELVAAEDGVEDWVGLFNKYAAIEAYINFPTQNPELLEFTQKPTLGPYVVTDFLGTGTNVRLERNPYYWKIDTEGNQLPYIDSVLAISYQDAQSRSLAMLNGDIDFLLDPSDENRALYFDAIEQGAPLRIAFPGTDSGTTNTIHFNRTIDNPILAEVFANRDFRIGMSHAINRQEIIDIVHFGQGTPSQAAPIEDSPLFNEQLAYQYTEYDVDLANEYLDRVLPDKDDEGFRLGPDGERFSFVFFVPDDLSYGGNWVQIAEFLVAYWRAVGVEVLLNALPNEQFVTRKDQNLVEAALFTGEGGAGLTPILQPRYYIPGEYFGIFGNGWWAYRTRSAEATQVEWPEDIAEIRLAYEQVLQQPGQEAQISAMADLIQRAADEFWVIGIARPGSNYYPYNARLGNIPETWIRGWTPGVHKIIRPEQWFINE